MSAKPPPIPELVYQRVMKVARFDGHMVMWIAGIGALLAAAGGSHTAAVAACLAAGTGAMEIHGSQQLARGNERGVNWLVRAQLLLMFVILAYATWQLTHFNEGLYRELIPQFREYTEQASRRYKVDNPYDALDDAQLMLLFRMCHTLLYAVVGFVTCIYQGLMARYYFRRREAVAKALDMMCE
ncbi:hypothetical protein M2103_001783 [Ereboglobus sp. PH5-5]|uniref:hypothetical protein n=1 Tax=Ereboglobus sp. PH5-5 TaxID=2940529 RepID=UPI002405D751|nr:hypothetical protein [Ereboglobus sp. PH5-5]MDF9833556.1 hypothetical protein [Ereboglobus sp. PH5-5]